MQRCKSRRFPSRFRQHPNTLFLLIGFYPTDTFGEFAVNITVPASMPTANNSILMARDLEGNCDAIYMDVTGSSGGGGIPGFEYLVAVIGLVSVVIAFLKKKDFFT